MIDQRYTTIKVLVESGHITTFRGIFDYIPKTTVYKDLRVNFNRFSMGILDPSKFTLGELRQLAEFFDMDTKKLIDMAYTQMLTTKKEQKRNKND
jgi:hypothetical protein